MVGCSDVSHVCLCHTDKDGRTLRDRQVETKTVEDRDRWRRRDRQEDTQRQEETDPGGDRDRWTPRDRWKHRDRQVDTQRHVETERQTDGDIETWGQEGAERQTYGHPAAGGDGDSWRRRREEVNRLGVVVGVERSL